MTNELDDLYQETLMDHAKSKKNRYKPLGLCSCVSAHNPLCGDEVDFYVVKDGRNFVVEACYEGKGCAISQAATSIAADSMIGLSSAEASDLLAKALAYVTGKGSADGVDGDWGALGGVVKFPMRVKCASMGIRAALGALQAKQGDVHEI